MNLRAPIRRITLYLSPMLGRFLHHFQSLSVPRGLRALVAVSGGSDSVALLDLLVATHDSHGLNLLVAHVDHGIHPQSGAVAAQVEQLAKSYDLRCITGHLALGAAASETLARERRYQWLEETRVRETARYIITAHHGDDQAETVLLRVLHGSGPAGLAAMATERGPILRPLLPFRREELARHVHDRALGYWSDPANEDPAHLRSWLRGSLLPRIRERLPDVDQHLVRVAAQAASDRDAWDQALDLLPGLDWRAEDRAGSVAVAPLVGYDSTLGNTLLRAIARRAGCRLGPDRAEAALRFLRQGSSGARFELGNGWNLEIVFGRAHFVPDAADPLAPGDLIIEGDAGDGAVGRWRLIWRVEAAPETQQRDAMTAWFIPEPLVVRSWAAGDKVRPLGGRGSRLVVKCFQETRVPRHLRPSWPVLLDSAGRVVWVPGVCRSDDLVPPAGAEALRVDAATA